jgi:hypothetical protein
MRLFDVSRPAAVTALDELASAGVLTKRRLDRRTGGYLAMDVCSLLTTAERQLASTRWDNGTAKPARPPRTLPTEWAPRPARATRQTWGVDQCLVPGCRCGSPW